MKFVLDENTQIFGEPLPDNVINVHDLYVQNNFGKHGIDDKVLLRLCEKNNLTLITRDRKLAMRANWKKQDVVYASGSRGQKWIFISKEIHVPNGGKFDLMMQQALSNFTAFDSEVFIARPLDEEVKKTNMIDCYEDDEIVFSNSIFGHDVYVVGFSVIGEKKAVELRRRLVNARIRRVV